jgi:RNA polymerase sigma-70 factor (subfamily 1)
MNNRIDKETLQRHLNAHAPQLHAFVDKRIPPKLRRTIVADDVMQEVWIAAFQNLDTFRLDGEGSVERWLTRIAERKLLNAIKAASAIKRGGGRAAEMEAMGKASSYLDLLAVASSPCRTPSSEAAIAEAKAAVQIALASLPDQRRRAVFLRHVKGMHRAEIAVAMSKTKPAVNSLLFHGLKQMRESMGPAAAFLTDADSAELIPPEVDGDPGYS